jgi:hypothetical protein
VAKKERRTKKKKTQKKESKESKECEYYKPVVEVKGSKESERRQTSCAVERRELEREGCW